MSGRRSLEEQNYFAEEEEEEQDDPSFDEVVAQTTTDIGFLEESQPAPPPPAPEPAPAPQIDSNAPPAPINQPAPAPAAPPTPAQPQPQPEPASTQSLQEMLFQEQNTQLPEPEPFRMPTQNEINNSPLVQSILEEEQSIQGVNDALGTMLPTDVLQDVTPGELTTFYEQEGITPVGPFSGLNQEIATKNARLQTITTQLESMEPDNFTSQAQVDNYNSLLEEGHAVAGEINGLLETYREEGERLVEAGQESQESLDESLNKFDSLYGENGLYSAYQNIAGLAGVAQQGVDVVSGQFGMQQDIRNQQSQIINQNQQLRDFINQGIMRPASLDEAVGGELFKLTAAGRAAREKQIRDQQIATIGTTSQNIQQFSEDPGFQEFANRLTTTEVPIPGSMNLDARGRSLGETTVSVPAITNPYGGDPIPLNTDVLMHQREQGGPSLLDALGVIPDAPGVRQAGEALASIPGSKFDKVVLQGAPRLAYGEISGLAEAGRTGVEITRDILDPGRFAQRQARNRGRIAPNQSPILTEEGLSQAGRNISQAAREGAGNRYDELPWYVQLTGEVVLDPLNFVTPVVWARHFRQARHLRRFRKSNFTAGMDDAFRSGTTADTAYVNAVHQLSQESLSKIDSFKLADAQVRFSDVAKNSVKVSQGEADLFATRVTTRLHTAPETQWNDILNEEVGRLGQRNNKIIDNQTTKSFNAQLQTERASAQLEGNEFWRNLGGDFPKVLQDTPQWRAARNRTLPDVNDIFTADELEDVPLDKLMSVGYGPDAVMTERWQNLTDMFGHSRTIRPNGRKRYIIPPETGVQAVADDGPTDAMLEILRRTRGSDIEKMPQSTTEYWEQYGKAINQMGELRVPSGMRVDDVVRHPDFLALPPGVGRFEPVRGGGSLPTDIRAGWEQLTKLQRDSIFYGDNLFMKLADNSGAMPGSPFSSLRANHIINTLPPTQSLKNEITKLAAKQKVKIDPRRFDNMTRNDALDLQRTLRGDEPRSVQEIVALYSDDAYERILSGQAMRGVNEWRAILSDILTPIEEGRYVWTAGVKRPANTTAAGYLRLSEQEILDIFAKAPERIRRLPNYGPQVEQIGETVQFIAKRLDDPFMEASPNARAELVEEARELMQRMIDDAPEVASPGETGYFINWMSDVGYKKSSLPRFRQIDQRFRQPDSLRQSGAPTDVRINQAASELEARMADRGLLLDRRNRFKAIESLISYTDNAGKTFRLTWDELANLVNNPSRFNERVTEFFSKHPTMNLAGFDNLIREANFMLPRKPGSRVGTGKALSTARVYADTQSAIGKVDRELREFMEVADELAKEAGLESIDDTVVFSNGPSVKQLADELGQSYSNQLGVKPNTPEARRLIMGDASMDLVHASIQTPNLRPPDAYTPPIVRPPHQAAQRDVVGRVSINRSSWNLTPEIRRGVNNAISVYDADTRNPLAFAEVAARLTPPNAAADDEVSRALLVMGMNVREGAQAAGIPQNAFRRLKSEVGQALEGQGVSRQRISRDASALRDAAELTSDAIEIEARRLGDSGVRFESKPKVTLNAGVVELPRSLNEAVRKWIQDIFDQRAGIVAQPGELTVRSAKWTRERALQALDFVDLQLTSNSDELTRWMQIEGLDPSPWVKPRHQRPVVNAFHPFAHHLGKVDWERHGRQIDDALRVIYKTDDVWGTQMKGFDKAGLEEFDKMEKSIKIGDYTSVVATRAWDSIFNGAALEGRAVTEVYDAVLREMDEIVEGGPKAAALYGSMFDNTEEMQLWLRWARTPAPDSEITKLSLPKQATNWDVVKAQWGDLTPHMSITRVSDNLFNKLFPPRASRFTQRQAAGRGPGSGAAKAKLRSRKTVLDDVDALDDFIHGRLDLSDLEPPERIEADLWREMLEPRWESEIKPQFIDAASRKSRKGIHVNDLDALFFPDEAFDPTDVEKFSENLGTRASQIEMARLGYDPNNLPSVMRFNMFFKRMAGIFWLRIVPRYFINNTFGNYMNVLFQQTRPEVARGLRAPGRVMQSLDSKTSSITRHRTLNETLASTEFGRDMTGGGLAKRKMKRTNPDKFNIDMLEASPKSKIRQTKDAAGAPFKAWYEFWGNANNYIEMHARTNVWSREFDHHYRGRWTAGLDNIQGLTPELRESLAGKLETADVAKVLQDSGLTPRQRQTVFRLHKDALTQGELKAYYRTKEVLRDYKMRNRFDNIMDQVFPYQFWTTRNMLFVTGTVMDRPATMLHGMRAWDKWSEQWEGLPFSVQQRLHLFKMPEQSPVFGGEDIWIRPHNMTNPAFFMLPAVSQELQDAWKRYDDTTLFERLARTLKDGMREAWAEAGLGTGPQWDLLATVGDREDTRKWMDKKTANKYSQFFDTVVDPIVRPQGFESDVAPLGGLEDIAQIVGYGGVGEMVQTYIAHGNKRVRGTPWAQHEVSWMARELERMAVEGKLGGYEENDDGTVNYAPEVEDNFIEVFDMVQDGDIEGLREHPLGSELLERKRAYDGERGGTNWATALSVKGVSDDEMRQWEQRQTYGQLKQEDDHIPLKGNVRNEENQSKINEFNTDIDDLHEKAQEHIRIHDFSPDAIAEANEMVEEGLQKIYNRADNAGLWVPQLEERHPKQAVQWAFGERNSATGWYENANAPFLPMMWVANDDPEEWRQYVRSHRDYQQRAQRWEAIGQSIKEGRERRGRTKPYFDQIDQLYFERDQELARLDGNDSLPEATKDRMAKGIIDRTSSRISGVYEQAEADGVSLKGTGRVPQQTSAWYDQLDTTNGDVRLLYEEAGLTIPKDVEIVPVDQIVSLQQKQDQIKAHTDYVMSQVVEAMDLHRFIPGTNQPNPRFVEDGVFSQEKYEQAVKRSIEEGVNLYDMLRRSMRGEFGGPPDAAQDVFARDITSKELREFIMGESLPREGAYQLRYDSALDDVYSTEDEDEKQAKIDSYREELGPEFMYWEDVGSWQVNMDDVAITLTNFYNGLEGEEQATFASQFEDILIGEGDTVAVDPAKLDGETVREIRNRYGIDVPTNLESYEESAGRKAIDNFWDELSNEQRDAFKEAFSSDEFEGFITSLTRVDDETGEPYQFDVIDVDALDPEQVAQVREAFEIPLPPDPRSVMLPGTNEDMGKLGLKPDQGGEIYTRVLERAAFDKETEEWRQKVRSGEAFIDDSEDRANWQQYYDYIGDNSDLYTAAREMKDRMGATWAELEDALEDRESEPGQGLTLKEFVAGLRYMQDEFNMGDLWDARSEFFTSEMGQSIFARDPEFFGRYVSDTSSFTNDSGGGGGGSSFGGGGGTASGGGGASAPSTNDFSGAVQDIFRLDSGMTRGIVPDAASRYDVAQQVGEIIEGRLGLLRMAFGDNSEVVQLFTQVWKQYVQSVLTEEPTLELWQQLLDALTRTGSPEPTDALREQPEFNAMNQDESAILT